jgi:hypothetical protein
LVKQLTFIGTGFNPQNANNTRSILNQFSIGGISAAAGLAASGSRFEGLTLMGNMIVHFNSQITGVVFKRCAMHRFINVVGSNWNLMSVYLDRLFQTGLQVVLHSQTIRQILPFKTAFLFIPPQVLFFKENRCIHYF